MTEPLSKGNLARAEILAAARRLFLSQGYNGTSMRAIAREAGGRAVAGLYNHFPTKEAIFRGLIEEQNPYGELFEILDTELVRAQTAPGFVRAVLARVLLVMPRHHDFVQLVQIDLREFEGRTVEDLLQHQLFPRLFQILSQVQTLPGLKPVDPVILVRLMASVVLGFMITDQLAPRTVFSAYSRAEWAGLLADALLQGLAAPEQPASAKGTDSL